MDSAKLRRLVDWVGKGKRILLLAKAKSSKSFYALRARFCIFSLDSAKQNLQRKDFRKIRSFYPPHFVAPCQRRQSHHPQNPLFLSAPFCLQIFAKSFIIFKLRGFDNA